MAEINDCDDGAYYLNGFHKLADAIREHRDERGNNRCWMDDEALYQALPEGYTPPEREVAVELQNCERFLTCRRNPATKYVSPQVRIEELEDALKAAYRQISGDFTDGGAWLDDVALIKKLLSALGK